MRIFITGGTGFIGQALCQQLLAEQHDLTQLIHQKPLPAHLQAVKICQNLDELNNLDGFDAVINLAGAGIFDKRWTEKRKGILKASRLETTEKLVRLIQASHTPPNLLLSGSAIGIYGDVAAQHSDLPETQMPLADNFAAQLCQQWEQTALQAQSPQTCVCLLRTGTVMSLKGGALAKMAPLYRFWLAGRIGSGKQRWAWISLNDQVRAILFLLNNNLNGAFNLVAPEQRIQADFHRLLCRRFRCPSFAHSPEASLKLILGERANLLLDNQAISPHRLLEAGFSFQDPQFERWLPEQTF